MRDYFNKTEMCLWAGSVCAVFLSFIYFYPDEPFIFIASIIGITSLILCAKGNTFGMLLMVIFGCFYGASSFEFGYYGETVTYVGMTVPMSIVSLVSWLKNPYKKNEVKIKKTALKDILIMSVCCIAVTIVFYCILKCLQTKNLVFSTISVSVSFCAVFLTFVRSSYYALAYALNDVMVIILWSVAAFDELKYIGTVMCFAAFFVNDIYGFINWKITEKRQKLSV